MSDLFRSVLWRGSAAPDMRHHIVRSGRWVVGCGKKNAGRQEKNKWRGEKSKNAGQRRLAKWAVQRTVVDRHFAMVDIGENLADGGGRRVMDVGLNNVGL